MRIDIGFFVGLEGRDTVLIDGDPAGLFQLARVLRTLEIPNTIAAELHKLAFVCSHGGLEFTAHPIGKELGVRRCGTTFPDFCWYHSEEGWLEAAEKIEQVASDGVGHNWLESIGVEDAVVMVSSGEYPPSFWLACDE